MQILTAVVQLNCTSDQEKNWSASRALIRKAAGYGARLVATPENSNFLGLHEDKVRLAEELSGPTCRRFAALAKELEIHLLLGSFNEVGPDSKHCYNTSVLFSPAGEILATYRKIHLFDVALSRELTFRESDTVAPGSELVLQPTPLGTFGFSICYDLRFAELYTGLAERGAEAIFIPSAFTATTGKAHWEVLVRARAIESQSFILAPAQTGKHDDRGIRESHGHSMIVDPWGHVLAQAGVGPGLALAEIDLQQVQRVRQAMPVREHRRVPVQG